MIDSNALLLLETLIDQASKSEQGMRALQQPEHETLGSDDKPAPDRFDREAITEFFNPEESEANYSKATTNGDPDHNKLAVKMGAKLTSDLLGQLQRDYKQQTVTPIRSVALASSRRLRQGSPGGPIQNLLIHTLQTFETY